MNAESCARFDSELTGWLEKSWEQPDRSVPPELAKHTDHCDQCRRRLNLAIRLLSDEHEAPDGLAETVMARVAGERRPRTHSQVSVLAAAALLVVSLGLGLLIGTTDPNDATVELTLYAPAASSVAVVGGWNGWDPTRDPMIDPDGDGVWQIELRLESGTEHLYQFVIDQETRTPDPGALLNVEDGFGGVNSVMSL